MKSPLNETETKLLAAMQLRVSDRKRCELAGLSMDEALRMTADIRTKLGLAPGASLKGVTP